MDRGDPLSVRGTFRGLRTSSTGKSLYLLLSETSGNTALNGVILRSGSSGLLTEDYLTPLIGKTVILSGELYVELTKRRFVKISSPDAIQVVD